ncbi:hypothetical protein GIB67_000965 [Kingdonia uniflora]|uniref:Transcription factor CBF/NF-Y/archaeal histone domain-containing protein n=1 Tax=Kingdonia uniflora TaxID=39325 RepID=A0A7J7MFZ1_9MAGN|nr:hypothetical protein GIB67_000965 [Kingdonia uniflora]
MEHGEGNNVGQKLDEGASAVATVVVGVAQPEIENVDDSATAEVVAENVPNVRVVKDPFMYMPVANVIRIMRKVLPYHAKISDDAKETVQQCVFEFIRFVTQMANAHCHYEQRKTVIADDLIWALGRLGFNQYIAPLSVYLHRYRESEADRGTARGDPMMGRIMSPMMGPVVSPVMGPPQGPFGNKPFMPQVHMGMPMMGQQQPPPAAAFYGGPMGPYFMDGAQFNMSPNLIPNQPMNNNQAQYPMNVNPAQYLNPGEQLNPTQLLVLMRRNNPYGP